jgi:Tfp pilus assembly protein PilO
MMEQFFKLTAPQKAGVLAAVLAVIGAGGYFLLIDPAVAEAKQNERDLSGAQAELTGLVSVASQDELARLKKHKDEMVEADKENRKMLPSNAEVPDLIETVQRDALANGLTVSRFDRLDTRNLNLVDAVPVRMTVTGSMIDVIKFLRIYASPERRVLHLRKLTIERIPPDPGIILRELRASLTPDQIAAIPKRTPAEIKLETIEVLDLARKKSVVRATFTAYAFTWTGKPPPEDAEPEALGKRKRT